MLFKHAGSCRTIFEARLMFLDHDKRCMRSSIGRACSRCSWQCCCALMQLSRAQVPRWTLCRSPAAAAAGAVPLVLLAFLFILQLRNI
jgi:hypothetical protein